MVMVAPVDAWPLHTTEYGPTVIAVELGGQLVLVIFPLAALAHGCSHQT